MANYKYLTATNQTKVGAGKLYGIFVSTISNGTITIYDSPASSTDDPLIANTITVAAGGTYLNCPTGLFFNKGLYIVTGGTVTFTVVYE